jgi:uncharacterized protein YbbK (DUF523 family)
MNKRSKILISACLLGDRVRHDGGDARCAHPILDRWQNEGRLVPICPEVAGGLSTPRPAAELVTTAGGRRVLTIAGADVTNAFERGADEAVERSLRGDVRVAILKDGSPSCGSQTIYDGSFSGRRIPGQGFTAARLIARGVRVFSESEIEIADEYVRALERR